MGDYIKPDKVGVGSFLDQWIRDYEWPNLSPKTAEDYDIMAQKHMNAGANL